MKLRLSACWLGYRQSMYQPSCGPAYWGLAKIIRRRILYDMNKGINYENRNVDVQAPGGINLPTNNKTLSPPNEITISPVRQTM